MFRRAVFDLVGFAMLACFVSSQVIITAVVLHSAARWLVEKF